MWVNSLDCAYPYCLAQLLLLLLWQFFKRCTLPLNSDFVNSIQPFASFICDFDSFFFFSLLVNYTFSVIFHIYLKIDISTFYNSHNGVCVCVFLRLFLFFCVSILCLLCAHWSRNGGKFTLNLYITRLDLRWWQSSCVANKSFVGFLFLFIVF